MKQPKLIKGIILIIFISLLITGCNKNNNPSNQVKDNDNVEDHGNNIVDEDKKEDIEEDIVKVDEIEESIKSMTLEEKVGQLIIAGFDGLEISDHTIDLINKYKLGGFILFARNIESPKQTIDLLNNLKLENSNNPIPLFLSIDEEGGKVSRLPSSYIKLPEAIKFGDKDNKEISYGLGEILGKRVKSLGFNIDFAPVLDIYSNPKNKVIGSRAYGSTSERVVNNGIEVMKGIRNTGIIPAVKHFPGHGDTSLDSHIDLPRVNKNLDQLKSLELKPFKEAIKQDVEIIMVAHILYPEIDPNYPGSISRRIIQDLLRDEMKYNGLVASDDMTMGAIIKNYALEDGVLNFIKSGGDLALICHGDENPILAIDKIIEAVNNGEILEEEIDEKVYRIIKLKKSYNLQDRVIQPGDLEELNNETKLLIQSLSN